MIHAITEQEFIAGVGHAYGLPWVVEMDWYAAPPHFYATVLHDKFDKDYSFVILGRDQSGAYRCIRTGISKPERSDAVAAMNSALSELIASGRTVFPQE